MRRFKRKKQKKILIITSLSLLLFLCVGYAAFQTELSIKAKGNIKKVNNATNIIKNLVETNSNELYIDNHGDVRYYGNYYDTDNYVTFNNEPWRIIGVIDGKVKIIRNEQLPVVTTDNGVTVATEICYINNWCDNFFQWNTRGTNNWNNSTLNYYLNGTYYNSIDSNFKNMISKETYYLGGPTSNNYTTLTASQYYDIERSNNVFNGNPTTIVQNIGLVYVSDIIYSAGEKYINVAPSSYQEFNSSMTFISSGAFTLTPLSDVSDKIITFNTTGSYAIIQMESVNETASYWYKYGAPHARPVLYLNSNVQITGGDGSQSNPFTLSQ